MPVRLFSIRHTSRFVEILFLACRQKITIATGRASIIREPEWLISAFQSFSLSSQSLKVLVSPFSPTRSSPRWGLLDLLNLHVRDLRARMVVPPCLPAVP